jgi:hypothetical protein
MNLMAFPAAVILLFSLYGAVLSRIVFLNAFIPKFNVYHHSFGGRVTKRIFISFELMRNQFV